MFTYFQHVKWESLTIWTPIIITDNILMGYVMDNKQTFETSVLPQSLTNHVLKLTHEN